MLESSLLGVQIVHCRVSCTAALLFEHGNRQLNESCPIVQCLHALLHSAALPRGDLQLGLQPTDEVKLLVPLANELEAAGGGGYQVADLSRVRD